MTTETVLEATPAAPQQSPPPLPKLHTVNVGTREDGRPQTLYIGEHVFLPGPITGVIRLADGTMYDVTPDVIAVLPEHVGELNHEVGLRYEDEGHPAHGADEPFLHLCVPACGDGARPLSNPNQALAAARAEMQYRGVADPVHAHEVGQAFGLVDPDAAPPVSMALASAAAENAALNGLDGTGSTNVIPDVSLHTATTSTTGASENANSGSYARQACSWNAASSGSKTNSTALTFSTLGTIAVAYFGTWSSATYGAGTFAIGGALTASVTAASITIASGGITLSAS